LLKYVQEYGKYVEITGFREVEIGDAEVFLAVTRGEKQQNVCVQFFNAELVASWQHLYFAVLNALLAFRIKRNISKSVAMETMLYASAQRQIRKAIAFIGVKRGSANVGVVIIGDDRDSVKAAISSIAERVRAEPDETVLEFSGDKVQGIRKAFGITDTELEAVMTKDNVEHAVVDLVVERMALLQTQL
jgi:tRNA threonylcarbamoyladenosine modification (KEOPS) complex Cgi121 subunit